MVGKEEDAKRTLVLSSSLELMNNLSSGCHPGVFIGNTGLFLQTEKKIFHFPETLLPDAVLDPSMITV